MLNEWLPKDIIKTFAWEDLDGKSLYILAQTFTEDNWETTVVQGLDRTTGITYVLHTNSRHTSTCTRPPIGWECSRDKGHEGPCAAHPVG